YFQGWLEGERGNSAEARKLLAEAVARGLTTWEVHYQLGKALLALGARDEARSSLSEAIRKGATDWRVWWLRSELVPAPEGRADLTEAIRRGADDPAVWLRRGLAHDEAGEPDLARKDFDTALQKDERQWRAWDARGWLRFKLGDPAGAEDDLTRAVALAPA